ncbi:hypothetical protein [Polyangium sp. 6x1]|uniref:hypothetical protein n=1 Tax=Polyangium sp. 6x1 TaxID=3042689 RepID=UPI002482AEB4|nr:hypothetical protein [Polyangium sp. 6x1]MDI1447225.1 hypothetical protein [Polyangium sp. 6x1]
MTDLVPKPLAAIQPARTRREVVRLCDPDEPLRSTDTRYEDFSPARSNGGTEALEQALELRAPERFVHAAFVSHRGAGKSTEILRLASRLAAMYEPVYLEATVEMDPFSIEAEDLLLNLALSVESTMRERNMPLPDALLERVRKWFEEVVSTTKWVQGFNAQAAAGVEAKVSSPFFGGVFGSLKALFKQESEYRTEVKQVLRKYPGTLLQSVNELFDEANKRLGGRSLLVIVDNLDRYDPVVIDKLLGDGADRIRQLRCNLLLTPPIGLLLQPRSAQLDRIYTCHFLYAVRLRTPEQRYDEFEGPGRDLMEKALRLRVDIDTLLPDKAARDRLISASGGSMRELLDLMYQSVLLTREEKITEAEVEKAVALRRQRLRDLINANGWIDTLVRIATEKQIHTDPKCMAVLHYYLAFKYNGDGWYDIHPLVDEIPEFKRAFRGEGG